MNIINDEFTSLPVSRQRRCQMRRAAKGLCIQCGEPAQGASLCPKHLAKQRHRARVYYGCKSWQKGGKGRPPLNARRKAGAR